MTREIFTPSPLYTIATLGPYPITHPYQVGSEIACTIFLGTTIVELTNGTDFTVAPSSSETTGDVTLSAAIYATYAGAALLIRRVSVADQGWAGQTAREKGLEAQLDGLIQRLQEIDEAIARSVKIPEGIVGELPLDYASTWLGFDSNKVLIAAAGAAGVPVSTFMATLLDDADAAAALTTLGAPGLAGSYSISAAYTFTSGGANLPTSKNATAGFTHWQTGAATDLGVWRTHVTTDGSFHIDPMPDDLSGYLGGGLKALRDTLGVTAYEFSIQGTQAAIIEGAGTAITDDQAVVTREKGDVRYLASVPMNLIANNIAIVSGGSFIGLVGTFEQPVYYECYLTCLTAEHGYTVGTRKVVTPGAGNPADKGFEINGSPGATLFGRFGSNASVFDALHNSTGIAVSLTNANWDLTVIGHRAAKS